MATTSKKGYILQGNGDNAGTWGEVLNNQMIEYVDANLGGITSKALTTGAVILNASESRNAILRLTGTLSGNVTITTSCRGFFFVENLTSGAYTVTIQNDSIPASASVVVPQSSRVTLISDTDYGVRIAGQDGFASGVVLVFYQANAPTGWTRLATQQDKALRVVNGTTSAGGVAGGTTAFTSVFTSRTIAQANLPNITLTSSADGNHNHASLTSSGPKCYSNSGGTTVTVSGLGTTLLHEGGGHSSSSTNNYQLNGPVSIPNSGTHTHTVSLGGSGTSLDFNVQYINVIICSKD